MGDPVRVGKVGMSGPLVRCMSGPLVRCMSGPLVRFADTRAACPYQKTAHSISCHVRISEASVSAQGREDLVPPYDP